MSTIFEEPDHWPFTFSFSMVRAGLDRVEQAVRGRTRDVASSNASVSRSLRDALVSIPYLWIRRDLTLLVENRSGWTACFDNGPEGSDSMTTGPWLVGALGEPALMIGFTPRFRPVAAPYAGADFVYYEARPPNVRRSIQVWQDGKQWFFEDEGEPLPGEDLSPSVQRRFRDRLRPDRLVELARLIGVDLDARAFAGETRLVARDTSKWRQPSPPPISVGECRKVLSPV